MEAPLEQISLKNILGELKRLRYETFIKQVIKALGELKKIEFKFVILKLQKQVNLL
ncbi:hypothetical protein Syun_007855 [Stephania yunnanensis]|uniref:Uncharacterized protein n=1 Tax=Stephania yunnanensis TaxID=152371 RepID=A0AAP0Q0M6_9MAGN